MEGILALMVPIVAIIGAFIMIVYVRKYENQERMAMIEKGVDPSLFTKKPGRGFGPLRAALLLLGAGIGLLLGSYLSNQGILDEEPAYFSMIMIFGGIGLGTAYLLEERKRKSEPS